MDGNRDTRYLARHTLDANEQRAGTETNEQWLRQPGRVRFPGRGHYGSTTIETAYWLGWCNSVFLTIYGGICSSNIFIQKQVPLPIPLYKKLCILIILDPVHIPSWSKQIIPNPQIIPLLLRQIPHRFSSFRHHQIVPECVVMRRLHAPGLESHNCRNPPGIASTGVNSFSSLDFASEQMKHGGSLAFWPPIWDISSTDPSRKDWISSGQGSDPEAGQGDLNGVSRKAERISYAASGAVDMPETARTLQLLMDRALRASAGVRHVAAYTPGNLLENMETPTPVPQATRPRVSTEGSATEAWLTRRPISSPTE
ncbi:lipid-transfer protein [Striga asiatica]|uniref:Lipid-transfer protein n=1 Tax=Striga asiatica TaxID=4170 RepID=A0A5A7QVX4_STRAF|nr:lipid-transfer protein [Striga asiatica]